MKQDETLGWIGTTALAVYLVAVAMFASITLIQIFPSVGYPEVSGEAGGAGGSDAKSPHTGGAAARAQTAVGSGGTALAGSSSGGTAADVSAPGGGGGDAKSLGSGGARAGVANQPSGGAGPTDASGEAGPGKATGGAGATDLPTKKSAQDTQSANRQEGLEFGNLRLFGCSWRLSADQGLLLLALIGGLLGSFMHTAQSLAAYVGNRKLMPNWVLWYLLRPPIGGILGLLFYFLLRAGLIPGAGPSNSNAISPYGVVAFGGLAGWFARRATDKLGEVFSVMFQTAEDPDEDGLIEIRPKILSASPAKIAAKLLQAGPVEITLTCKDLAVGAKFHMDAVPLIPTFPDGTHAKVVLPTKPNAEPGDKLHLIVSNDPPRPGGQRAVSDVFDLELI